nr:uncharacterized protein LOC109730855 [Microcebus murinus]
MGNCRRAVGDLLSSCGAKRPREESPTPGHLATANPGCLVPGGRTLSPQTQPVPPPPRSTASTRDHVRQENQSNTSSSVGREREHQAKTPAFLFLTLSGEASASRCEFLSLEVAGGPGSSFDLGHSLGHLERPHLPAKCHRSVGGDNDSSGPLNPSAHKGAVGSSSVGPAQAATPAGAPGGSGLAAQAEYMAGQSSPQTPAPGPSDPRPPKFWDHGCEPPLSPTPTFNLVPCL